MANFDINNFVIDRPLRGTFTQNGEIKVMLTQIENPQLTCASEETDAVDALGVPIMTFERAKTANFSAENSIWDLGLYAAQMGTEKNIASADNMISTPAMETVMLAADQTTYTLLHAPEENIQFIYIMKGDDTLSVKYTVNSAASDTEFAYDAETHTITLPTGIPAKSRIFIKYTYLTENAVEIVNSAKNFPGSGEFVLEVLGKDVCDPDNLIYAYVIFENSKLLSSVDLNLTTEGKHPFELRALQNYCDAEKKLFRIVIPEMPTAA